MVILQGRSEREKKGEFMKWRRNLERDTHGDGISMYNCFQVAVAVGKH